MTENWFVFSPWKPAIAVKPPEPHPSVCNKHRVSPAVTAILIRQKRNRALVVLHQPLGWNNLLDPQAQAFAQGDIALVILAPEIIQQPPAAADHLQQSPPGGFIVGIGPEVIGQVADPFGQDGNLHFRGTGIALMSAEFLDDFLFLFFC
jgi:hypothetical protein